MHLPFHCSSALPLHADLWQLCSHLMEKDLEIWRSAAKANEKKRKSEFLCSDSWMQQHAICNNNSDQTVIENQPAIPSKEYWVVSQNLFMHDCFFTETLLIISRTGSAKKFRGPKKKRCWSEWNYKNDCLRPGLYLYHNVKRSCWS